MKNLRTWGKAPYRVVAVHGGPGAPGGIGAVARELSKDCSILEPFQTKDTIDGQVAELVDVTKKQAEASVVLIGHSWGAILSYVATARHPDLVSKLILIGMAPIIPYGKPEGKPARSGKLSPAEQAEMESLGKAIWEAENGVADARVSRYFYLRAKASCYDFLPIADETVAFSRQINISVGTEMGILIASGDMMKMSKNITCPLTVICGQDDPLPSEPVRESFTIAFPDANIIMYEKCGHYPWLEKYARDKFFEVLPKEIL